MARYCTCGAMLDINGLRNEEALQLIKRWESIHWKWSKSQYSVPIGRPGHEYSGGPVMKPGEHVKTGGAQ